LRIASGGTGDLSLAAFKRSKRSTAVTVGGMDAGFSGQFELIGSGSPDARLDVEFTTAFPEAGLVYAAKAGATLPRLVLSGGERFASARLPAAEGGMVDLKLGTYDAAGLKAAGVAEAVVIDEGGTLRIGP